MILLKPEESLRRSPMSGINKVIVVGRLGADPEVKYTNNGVAVARFSVATSDQWLDKTTGEKKERTEWHRVVVWNKLAELCGQYLGKGKQVYVEGPLQTRSWEDRDGVKRFTTEIRALTVQFLGASQGQTDYSRPTSPTTPSAPSEPPPEDPFSGEPAAVSEDDDIPF